jgi:hypothetical protein
MLSFFLKPDLILLLLLDLLLDSYKVLGLALDLILE